MPVLILTVPAEKKHQEPLKINLKFLRFVVDFGGRYPLFVPLVTDFLLFLDDLTPPFLMEAGGDHSLLMEVALTPPVFKGGWGGSLCSEEN